MRICRLISTRKQDEKPRITDTARCVICDYCGSYVGNSTNYTDAEYHVAYTLWTSTTNIRYCTFDRVNEFDSISQGENDSDAIAPRERELADSKRYFCI